jgi:hypothetical protein
MAQTDSEATRQLMLAARHYDTSGQAAANERGEGPKIDASVHIKKTFGQHP